MDVNLATLKLKKHLFVFEISKSDYEIPKDKAIDVLIGF